MSVYNGMPYLKEAVQSILFQTYSNFEFIIVDDASTDKTWQYLKSLKDKRVKLIKNEKNLGIAASLNKALKIARGDYIARMDADDISLPRRLEIQLGFLQRNHDIDLCGTWADLIDENDKIIGEKKFPKNHEDINRLLMFLSPVIHPTFFAKSIVFKKLSGYDPRFEYCEDYHFLLRAKDVFKISNIAQKLFQLRLWEKRRSRESMKKIDRADLKTKIEALKKGYYAWPYTVIVLVKLFITYLVPYKLKIPLAKLNKLA